MFIALGGGIAVLMCVYGGVQYVYSADDPGGRKKAIQILVQAIVGGIILTVAKAIIEGVAGVSIC